MKPFTRGLLSGIVLILLSKYVLEEAIYRWIKFRMKRAGKVF